MNLADDTFKYFERTIYQNSGKLLHTCCEKGKRLIYQRDREEDQSYYEVRIRGNKIMGFVVRYELEGKGVNMFTSLVIPTLCGSDNAEEVADTMVCVRKLILELPIRNKEEFLLRFKELTPNLYWWD